MDEKTVNEVYKKLNLFTREEREQFIKWGPKPLKKGERIIVETNIY